MAERKVISRRHLLKGALGSTAVVGTGAAVVEAQAADARKRASPPSARVQFSPNDQLEVEFLYDPKNFEVMVGKQRCVPEGKPGRAKVVFKRPRQFNPTVRVLRVVGRNKTTLKTYRELVQIVPPGGVVAGCCCCCCCSCGPPPKPKDKVGSPARAE